MSRGTCFYLWLPVLTITLEGARLISTRQVMTRVVGLSLLLAGGAYLLYLVRDILSPFIWGGVMAYLLERPVTWIEKKGWSRSGAIFTTFFVLGGLLLLGGGLLLPSFIKEIDHMGDQFPRYIDDTRGWFSSVRYQYDRVALPLSVRLAINDAFVRMEASMVNSLKRLVEGVIFGYSSFITLIFAPILSYYLLKDAETIKRRFTSLLPSGWRSDVLGLMSEIDDVLIGFIKGNLLIALIVGTLTAVTLNLLGVDYALTLGFIAGISDFIPYLGPLIGGVPAVAVAMLESSRLALYVALSIFIIHQLEGGIIAPKILGDRVGLNPLLVVFALLAGGKLWGMAGMILGVPLAASIKVIISFIYNRWLGVYPR